MSSFETKQNFCICQRNHDSFIYIHIHIDTLGSMCEHTPNDVRMPMCRQFVLIWRNTRCNDVRDARTLCFMISTCTTFSVCCIWSVVAVVHKHWISHLKQNTIKHENVSLEIYLANVKVWRSRKNILPLHYIIANYFINKIKSCVGSIVPCN